MVRIKVGGLKATIAAFGAMQAKVKAAQPLLLDAGGAALLSGVQAAAGLQDGHTQPVLDALDNPYARRHGTIQEGVLGHPGWWVHRQTGTLFKAISGGVTNPITYEVSVDSSKAPYAPWVIGGTKVMFARDFVWIAGELRVVRRRIMRAMVRVLGKQLRTKAHVRFGDPGIPGSIPQVRDSQGRFV